MEQIAAQALQALLQHGLAHAADVQVAIGGGGGAHDDDDARIMQVCSASCIYVRALWCTTTYPLSRTVTGILSRNNNATISHDACLRVSPSCYCINARPECTRCHMLHVLRSRCLAVSSLEFLCSCYTPAWHQPDIPPIDPGAQDHPELALINDAARALIGAVQPGIPRGKRGPPNNAAVGALLGGAAGRALQPSAGLLVGSACL
jgi:hypothetical protein